MVSKTQFFDSRSVRPARAQQKGPTLMRVLAVALALSTLLAASQVYAQGAAAPKPAGQAPAQPRPAPAPAAPAASIPAPLPQFQDGFKYAYVRIDRIAAESGEGKVLSDRV